MKVTYNNEGVCNEVSMKDMVYCVLYKFEHHTVMRVYGDIIVSLTTNGRSTWSRINRNKTIVSPLHVGESITLTQE